MDDLKDIWAQTLKLFQSKCNDNVVFDSFFSPLTIKEVIDNQIIITYPYNFGFDSVLEKQDDLQEIFDSLSDKPYHLSFMIEENYNKNHDQDDQNQSIEIVDNLNADMNFDTFVVGNSNRIAQNAALAVAMKPGQSYNPLFIHSLSGLGKTHLLNAIGNYIKQHYPGARILYITSEDFLNDYVKNIQDNTMDIFNQKYRSVDLLLIDDIQFLASKESSSEVLFNIFNVLQRDNKQIVITSDKPPKSLKGMEGRLVSRFMQGLTVSIDTPEFETSKAILKKKIEVEKINYPITEEVIDYIASHYSKDVRELEGSLKRLLFYKLISDKKTDVIDLDFALEAFGDTNDEKKNENKALTVDTIKQVVADYYNLSVEQLTSRARTSNVTIARHIAMYLTRTMINDISYIQIGKEFGGRDHSTVMKACDKVAKNIKKDENYSQAIDEIKARLI